MAENFRQQLVDSVAPEGRELYRASLEAIDSVSGRTGHIAALNIRILKGITQLQLEAACVTREGLATPDRAITDCSAAIVRWKKGRWERYSGKDSAHVTRIHSSYDSDVKKFSLWSEGDEGEIVIPPRAFSIEALQPKKGTPIDVKMEQETLQGVLERGALSEHVRECLRKFEKDSNNIAVLLRHEGFHRPSDTRDPPLAGVDTLYSDGAQIHAHNRQTLRWQNMHMTERLMQMASYRAGLELDGEEMLPNIEDLIYEIRVRTKEHGNVPVFFTSLTPRCTMPQRDLRTGAVHAQPKLWNKRHRPLRPWDRNSTMGVNADVPPNVDGAIIRVNDPFDVISEKKRWRLFGEF